MTVRRTDGQTAFQLYIVERKEIEKRKDCASKVAFLKSSHICYLEYNGLKHCNGEQLMMHIKCVQIIMR